ncbi:MAG TPA: TolC family protein [Gemmatimonadaceae bacterium]|jgi:outer membrane protein TolC|nr:TolC family protein [Gemmatimonadaceae bacterium]
MPLLLLLLLLAAARAPAQAPSGAPPWAPAQVPPDSASQYPLLTLAEVVKRAMVVSPGVVGGEGGVTNAISGRRVAFGAYLPTLSMSAASTGINTKGLVTQPPILNLPPTTSIGPVRIRNQTLGLTVGGDVYTGGLRRANDAFAEDQLRASRYALVNDREAATLAAVQAFYEVIRASENVSVARVALAQSETLLRYTLDKSKAGTAMRSDVLRAQFDLTTSREQLAAARDTLVSAVWTLGWLAGADGPVGARPDSESQAIRPLSMDDSTIVHYAASQSPSVNYAHAVENASDAGVRAARASYRPTVSASSSYIWATDPTVATSTSRPGFTITIGTLYPVFNGFQREDSLARARVVAETARATTADARRLARASAAHDLSTLHAAESNISLSEEAIRSAREDLRVQAERYRAGVSTILDVLVSQTALTRAGYGLALARQQYHIARAQLEALLGRRL